jgi:hypothetical protein
MGDTI